MGKFYKLSIPTKSIRGKENMKKTMIGFCIVLLLLIPSVSAINFSNSKFDTSTNSSINTAAPDLIIEKIIFEEGHFPFSWDMYCRVKNIGDGVASGENVQVTCEGTRLLFGIYPWKKVGSFDRRYNINLDPGESRRCKLASTTQFPMKLMFLKFSCTVNLNEKIYEEDYSNNYFNQKFLILIYSWRWI